MKKPITAGFYNDKIDSVHYVLEWQKSEENIIVNAINEGVIVPLMITNQGQFDCFVGYVANRMASIDKHGEQMINDNSVRGLFGFITNNHSMKADGFTVEPVSVYVKCGQVKFAFEEDGEFDVICAMSYQDFVKIVDWYCDKERKKQYKEMIKINPLNFN